MQMTMLRRLLRNLINKFGADQPRGRLTAADNATTPRAAEQRDTGEPARLDHIICPLRHPDLVPEDPLNYRAEYWATYGAFVPRALRTLGVQVLAPAAPAEDFSIAWHFADGSCVRTGISYSDFFWDYDSSLGMDGLFKIRYHPTRKSDIKPRLPVAAAGFGLAVSGGYGDNDEFIANTLPQLRRIKDEEPQAATIFFNPAHFRTIGIASPDTYPNRERFRQALRVAQGNFEPAGRWLESVARSSWVLNLCGSGNSIDRKVVELCAIGCAIISDRGLEDLELPYGRHFVHGENIWFVDNPEDLLAVPEVVTGDVWRRLVDGSRELYMTCFQPEQAGRWYLKKAREWAQ